MPRPQIQLAQRTASGTITGKPRDGRGRNAIWEIPDQPKGFSMKSSRRQFLAHAGAAIGCAALTSSTLDAKAGRNKPNVLFIFTDDQRFDTIGALGNRAVITPALDRLAGRSFVFRNAYCMGGNAGAVCIPARNMAMSGRAFTRFRYDPKQKRLVESNTRYADPEKATFPKSMRAAGYETYYSEKSGTANLPQIQTQFQHRQNVHMVSALKTGRPAKKVVDDAVTFLKSKRDKTRPFFMYLGLPCPHDPRWSTKRFRSLYTPSKIPLPPNYRPIHPWDIGSMTVRDERLEAWPRTKDAIRRHLHDYYALISSMDHDIGRLLDGLDEIGLTENTIIVFSSDQGVAIGSHGLMGKQNIYDDTMRVPLMIAGPGIKKGESAALAYIHDIFPTVCDLVGADAPKKIDGLSLASVIRGREAKVRDALFLAYIDTQRSVRDKRWKLIRFPKINRTLLFDLSADPRETRNLAEDATQKATVSRMMALLAAEQKHYGDPLPLTSARPAPAEFAVPKLHRKSYRGGQAPNEGGDPERPTKPMKKR
jgi:arylsulfatase A-like enzyme